MKTRDSALDFESIRRPNSRSAIGEENDLKDDVLDPELNPMNAYKRSHNV